MRHPDSQDTRSRLLDAAAGLIAESPGESVSLRAVCGEVGVTLPTLYHFFGSKAGLLDAVTEHGYALYLAAKRPYDPAEDPIEHIRWGWDAHFAFGIDNPGLYVLMYGQIVPGRNPNSKQRVASMVLCATEAAESSGRLVVTADQAAAHVLAAVIGVTLRQVADGTEDHALSVAMREATIAAICGSPNAAPKDSDDLAGSAARLRSVLRASTNVPMSPPEAALLDHWLLQLASG
ncbi:TetR/AcrR family transcriptional regulator [Tomitella fengzijianii]|uniref:TetR/AcrR family transcriptional regulator n=1 Tax=Tomitella fengzijianii TaxID=2597660 RepID=A0A516WZM3_9ACTN|nr:TetR/AcrR family transcriptional regulator [Tomitella fengzijianii]QDQ96304.1 TetR/AcrR family transcriptional regulator [Tomitella fengzijianii]